MPEDNDDLEALLQESDDDSDLIKKLRGHLKTMSGSVKDATDKAQKAEREALLAKAGVDSLKPIQREALEGQLTKLEDVDVDKVRNLASELGFISAESGNNSGEDENGNQQQQQQGQQQTQQQQEGQPQMGLEAHVRDSMSSMMGMETAVGTGGAGEELNFEQKMRKAAKDGGAEALRNLILNEGSAHGVEHEWKTT